MSGTPTDEPASSLRIDRRDGVVTLTLNRPARRNAIDIPLWHALTAALREVAERDDDRVAVLCGAGGTFCAGGDLSESGGRAPAAGGGATDLRAPAAGSAPTDPLESATTAMRETVGVACLALHHLPKPTLAAVEGTAAGAGANLAFGCDLVIAARNARFGEVFVRRALPVDSGGSWLLPRLVGLQRAKQLAFFGDWIDAAEAERIGLVNRVVDAGSALHHAQEWAQRLAASSPDALRCIKRDLNAGLARSFDEALEAEARSLAECVTKPAFAEALKAFLKTR